MSRSVALAGWCVIAAALAAPCAAQPGQFADVIRNLRNPDGKARLAAVRMLHEAQLYEAAVPLAAVINDPVDAIQLEAIAAELSLFLVKDVPGRRRVGLIIEVRGKGQAPQAFELGPLATWPRAAPPELIDALLQATDDENARVRVEAIYALGVVARGPLGDGAAGRLIQVLDHYDPRIRAAAARVIGRLRVTRAGEALINAINDSDPSVRYAAMRALGELREERAVRALTEQFTYYATGEGAWAALDGLARIAHPSSAELFRSALVHKDPSLRRAAAEGVARLADASALDTVQAAATSDSSEMVRAAMSFAMVKLGQNYLARLVDHFSSGRMSLQIQEYLLELGPSVLAGLAVHLQEADAGVRAGVAEVIGALGTAATVELLEPLTKDRDRSVAETAAAAIERIKMRH
jgi:HEAT repeat protein